MKVLVVEKPLGLSESPFLVRLMADSAILRTGDPLFLPDHLGRWVSELCPAVHVGRLGTNIPPKAARSFCDSVSAVHLLIPAEGNPALSGDLAGILDRSCAPGRQTALDDICGDNDASEISLEARVDLLPRRNTPLEATATPLAAGSSAMPLSAISEAVVFLSKYATLKTGDIIVFKDFAIPLGETRAETLVSARVEGREALSLRIK